MGGASLDISPKPFGRSIDTFQPALLFPLSLILKSGSARPESCPLGRRREVGRPHRKLKNSDGVLGQGHFAALGPSADKMAFWPFTPTHCQPDLLGTSVQCVLKALQIQD